MQTQTPFGPLIIRLLHLIQEYNSGNGCLVLSTTTGRKAIAIVVLFALIADHSMSSVGCCFSYGSYVYEQFSIGGRVEE
ncbi:MAG: hypothetical protein ACJ70Y_06650 [Nitrososphaera sp.]